MITTCLSNLKFNSKPTQQDAAVLTKEIADKSCTLLFEDFVSGLKTGRTYTLATGFKNNTRSKANTISCQIFAADIDHDNLSLIEIQNKCTAFDIPVAIIYESFSSQPGNQRWRLLFIAREPISEPPLALAVMHRIADFFNSDAAIVDPSRMLYATTAEKLHYAQEIYFNALEIKDITKNIYNPGVSYTAKTKVKKTKAKLSKVNLIDIEVIKSRLKRGQDSRYMDIFNAALSLFNLQILSAENIVDIILSVISRSARFADYDRTEQQITNLIYNALNWAEKQN